MSFETASNASETSFYSLSSNEFRSPVTLPNITFSTPSNRPKLQSCHSYTSASPERSKIQHFRKYKKSEDLEFKVPQNDNKWAVFVVIAGSDNANIHYQEFQNRFFRSSNVPLNETKMVKIDMSNDIVNSEKFDIFNQITHNNDTRFLHSQMGTCISLTESGEYYQNLLRKCITKMNSAFSQLMAVDEADYKVVLVTDDFGGVISFDCLDMKIKNFDSSQRGGLGSSLVFDVEKIGKF